ncbi:hypothetical protein BH09BAC5_BH09BAC5_08830 [soil metagenome]
MIQQVLNFSKVLSIRKYISLVVSVILIFSFGSCISDSNVKTCANDKTDKIRDLFPLISKSDNICSISMTGNDIVIYKRIDSSIAYCDELLIFDRYKLLFQFFSDSSIIQSIAQNKINITIHQVASCNENLTDFVSPINNYLLVNVLFQIKDPLLFLQKIKYITARFDCHDVGQINYLLRTLKSDTTFFISKDTLFSSLYFNYVASGKTSTFAHDYGKLKTICRNITADTSIPAYDSLAIYFYDLDQIK